MPEKKSNDVDVLLKQVEEFEGTISELHKNLEDFKIKLLDKKKKYGPDISKWPVSEKK